MTPEEQLRPIAAVVRELVQRPRRAACTTRCSRPSPGSGLALLDIADLTADERQQLDRYFHDNVFPVLTPLAVDPAHPFPYISNLSLSLAVVAAGSGRRGAVRPGQGAQDPAPLGAARRRRCASCRWSS